MSKSDSLLVSQVISCGLVDWWVGNRKEMDRIHLPKQITHISYYNQSNHLKTLTFHVCCALQLQTRWFDMNLQHLPSPQAYTEAANIQTLRII